MLRIRYQFVLLACALLLVDSARAGSVLYLANEGVMAESGDTKVLFDPLFDNDYGQYQLLPTDMEAALFAGIEPFDNVDAVFVSHHHGDHFSPEPMLRYLQAQPQVRLYAPAQAVSQLRALSDDTDLFARVTGIALENGEPAMHFEIDGISIDVLRVPHSGWPNRMTDIENLVFRVTLDESATVAHFGDANADPAHFEPTRDTWSRGRTHVALPPYWFFLSEGGREILDTIVKPDQAIGTHVPTSIPDDRAARPPEVREFDLFTEPGQTRPLP